LKALIIIKPLMTRPITNKPLLKRLFYITIAFLTILLSAEVALARPNIILIQTDDQTRKSAHSFFINNKGKKQRTMPHLQKLIKNKGTEFTNYTVSSPSCAPSRASLLSGRYAHGTGMIGNGRVADGSWQALKNNSIINNNIATQLDQVGYKTIHVGKFYNGYRGNSPSTIETEIPPGWNEWITFSPKGGEFWNKFYFYGYFINWQGYPVGPMGSKNYRNNKDSKKCSPVIILSCNHQTDLTTAVAVSKITRSTTPFYMQLDFSSPHSDAVAPSGAEPSARHINTAQNTRLPQTPRTRELNTRDKPSGIKQRKPIDRATRLRLKKRYSNTLESLRGVDDSIKHIVNKLKETNKLNNTYIIFTSDNGLILGEHSVPVSKYAHYKPSSQVPLLIRGPEIPTGKSAEIVSNIDLAPTIADLASVNLSGDGRSMRPFWENQDLRTKRPLVLENFASSLNKPPKKRSLKDNYQGILIDDYKFIKYFNNEQELYDLKKDPHELYNQAKNPNYQQLLQEMSTALDDYKNCSGIACRFDLIIKTKPGKFITDAIAPPDRFREKDAYLYKNKIFLQASCPKNKLNCLVNKKVKTKSFLGSTKISLRRGQSKRVFISVPAKNQREVFQFLWRKKPLTVITTQGKKTTKTKTLLLER